MEEIWKDIKGYEGLYQVSNLGMVKSLNYHLTGRIKKLKLVKNAQGYMVVTLHKGKEIKVQKVHRLVAETFIPNSNNLPQVNHIDGNKENNNVNTLEWCTSSENQKHAYRTGLNKPRYGRENHLSKKVIQYDLNMKEIARYANAREVERQLGYENSCITSCCRKETKMSYGYIWRYEKEE